MLCVYHKFAADLHNKIGKKFIPAYIQRKVIKSGGGNYVSRNKFNEFRPAMPIKMLHVGIEIDTEIKKWFCKRRLINVR